jgi:hypothetical protein
MTRSTDLGWAVLIGLVATTASAAIGGAAAQGRPSLPASGRTTHGPSITCERGYTECQSVRSLLSCNLEQAGTFAATMVARRRNFPALKGCEVLSAGQNFEVEPTVYPMVVYAKEGSRHCREYFQKPSAYDGSDFLEVRETVAQGYESTSRILTIAELTPGIWQADLHSEGEGTEWLSHVQLQRRGNTLVWRENGRELKRLRCTSAQGGGRLR